MFSTQPVVATPLTSFHFCRVTRKENRLVEDRIVNTQEIRQLAADNQGLFAGGFANLSQMEHKLATLAHCESAERWVVASSSKQRLSETEARMREQADLNVERGRYGSSFWAGHLMFTTLEAISGNSPEHLDGVILYDPPCSVHRARKFTRYDGSNHDRPQILADFLAKRSAVGQPSLLCLMTLRPPLACNTVQIGEAYMLDGWIFADPFSLSFVDDPRGCTDESRNG